MKFLNRLDNYLSKYAKSIIYLGAVVFIAINIISDLFEIKGIWYYGCAFAFLCYSYANKAFLKTKGAVLIFILCVGQFSDELMRIAVEIHLFEYIIPVLYLGPQMYKKWKTR